MSILRASTVTIAFLAISACMQVSAPPRPAVPMRQSTSSLPNSTQAELRVDQQTLEMMDERSAIDLAFLLGLIPSKEAPRAATLSDSSMDAESDIYSRAVAAGCLGLLNYLKAYPSGRYVADARARMFAESNCVTIATLSELESYWPEDHDDRLAVRPISNAARKHWEVTSDYANTPSIVTWERAKQYLERVSGKKIEVRFLAVHEDGKKWVQSSPDDVPGAADVVLTAAVAIMAARYVDVKSVSGLQEITIEAVSGTNVSAASGSGWLYLRFRPSIYDSQPRIPAVEEILQALVGPMKLAPEASSGVIVPQ